MARRPRHERRSVVMTEGTLDDRLGGARRPADRRRRPERGARSGEPADDPALGRRVRGREPRVHRSRRGGALALRRDRRAAADAADVDDGDAADHRHGRTRRLAGRRRARDGARAARRRGLRRHARVELGVRDRALPARRRRRVGDDAARVGVAGEADAHRPRLLRHLGHHLHRSARRGRRSPAVPHPEVPTRRLPS